MKRLCLSAALAAAMSIAAAGCSNKSQNPGAPTSPTDPTPTVGIRAVVVSGTPTSTTTYQMSAKADMTDGSSRDVTTQSQWATSNSDVATIASSGVLTVVHSGQIEVRATFQSTTGTMPLTVSAPQPPPPGGPSLFILSGVVQETLPDSKPLGGATARITAGPDAGKSVVSSADGRFGFVAMHEGTVSIQVEKDGYIAWQLMGLVLDRDRDLEVVMFPTPPKNASGVSATARCNDKSWSWDQTRDTACAANGGIAYAVCPGPMCDMRSTTR